MNNSNVLTFNSTVFDVVDRNGQPWLRLPQIGAALGYANPYKVQKAFDRHSDEFTENMTAVIKLPDLLPQSGATGQMRETRIFSPRGCYALGMFARTKVAKDFRVWVLDVLEGKTKAAPALNYTRISPAQAQTLKEHVQRIVEAGLQTFGETWGRLHNKFRVNSYLELPATQFEEACAYLKSKNPISRYHFPLERADPHDREIGNAWLSPRVLTDPKNGVPELELIAQLEKDGHNVTGAKVRILAMREAMCQVEEAKSTLRYVYEKLGPLLETCKVGIYQYGKNVQFIGKPNPSDPISRFVYRDQM